MDERRKKLEALSNIHDDIKNHPYRLENDLKYLPDYQKLLYSLSCKFWDVIHDNYYYCKSTNMIHDFNYCIDNLNRNDGGLCIQHVERCLMIIHKFIDTGKLLEFYTYYTGCNILESMPRLQHYVYDEKKMTYIPEITKEQILNSINEIDEYYLKNPDKKFHQHGIYSEHNYNYYKIYYDRFYCKLNNMEEK